MKKENFTSVVKKVLEKEGKYISGKRNAAVLVPLSIDKALYITFIKRSKNLQFHRGEVAFPGGLRKNNESPLETAFREAWEELRIRKENVEVLGFLPPTETRTTNIYIVPVVGLIPLNYPFKLNKKEIEKVMQIPIKELYKNVYEDFYGKYYLHDGYKIWGATARILTTLLNKLKTIIK